MAYHRATPEVLVELTEEEAAPYEAGTLRHSMRDGVAVVFTDEEEKARDAEEAEWAAAAPARALQAAESESGMDRGEREIAIKMLPPESVRRQKAEKAEAAIVALKVRK